MRGRVSTEMGKIVIDTDVIAKYAGSVAMEVVGVVGMASINVKDGLWNLLRIENISHGVEAKIVDKKLEIHMHVIAAYGTNLKTVAINIIDSVKHCINEYIGMEVSNIIVSIEGVRVTE